ncbi:hypothetical protein G9A89_006688 [Geosiphon pyriformis]|nr:hypothetical protein G9A89_006688 [Geosiphon pyriformis]
MADVAADTGSHTIVAYFKGPHLTKSEWRSRTSKLVSYSVQGMQTNALVQVDEEWFVDVSIMMDALVEKINYNLKNKEYKKIIFCGHGVGGGVEWDRMQVVMHRDLGFFVLENFPFSLSLIGISYSSIDLSIYTFGEPRVGNIMFARMMNEFVKVTRITHKNDYVPHFPQIKNGLSIMQHHEDEIWIGPAECDCDPDTVLFEGDQAIWKCGKYRGRWESKLPSIQSLVEKKFWIPNDDLANENEECNAGQSITGSDEDLLHFGPYFSITMNDCSPFQ